MVYTSLMPYQKHGVISIQVFCQYEAQDNDMCGTFRSIRHREIPHKHYNALHASVLPPG